MIGVSRHHISTGAASGNGLLTGLVSYWKLDEASGTLSDSHGSHDATNYGATYGVSGVINNCMEFEASNTDELRVSYHSDFNFGTNDAFSISLWVYLNTAGAFQAFITNQTDFSNYIGWYLAVDSDDAVQFIHRRLLSSSRIFVDTNNNALSATTWCHVVLTYDGSGGASGVNIYLDGSAQSLNTITDNLSGTISTNNDIHIGSRDNSSVFLDGRLDEIGVWSRELSASDASALFNSGNALSYNDFTS